MTIGSMATALYSFGMPVARRSPFSLDFQRRISAPIRQPEPQPKILKPRGNQERQNAARVEQTHAGSLCLQFGHLESHLWVISAPKGGFPYLAETLRRAGLTRNLWFLPGCQSLYLTEKGPVVSEGMPLVSGTVDVPPFRITFSKLQSHTVWAKVSPGTGKNLNEKVWFSCAPELVTIFDETGKAIPAGLTKL
jgi:hypothetical protein